MPRGCDNCRSDGSFRTAGSEVGSLHSVALSRGRRVGDMAMVVSLRPLCNLGWGRTNQRRDDNPKSALTGYRGNKTCRLGPCHEMHRLVRSKHAGMPFGKPQDPSRLLTAKGV